MNAKQLPKGSSSNFVLLNYESLLMPSAAQLSTVPRDSVNSFAKSEQDEARLH